MTLTRIQREAIHDALANLCEQAKTHVRDADHYRATIILRATHLPDGDVVVTDDLQEKVLTIVRDQWPQ